MKAGTLGILIRLFAFRFYKEQMGFLLMIFGVIFSHIFWIKPLGGHLNHEDSVRFHLILLYSFASELIMLLLFFWLWIVYGMRVVGFMKRQLKLESNQFLFYSLNALSGSEQIRLWFGVFTVIFTPAVLLIVGIVYAGLKYAELLLLFYYPAILILLCLSISAFVVRELNRQWSIARKPFLTSILDRIEKPLWAVSLFNFLYHQKIVFLLIKLLAIVMAVGGIFLLEDLKADVRVFQLIILTLAVINRYMVYAMKKFEDGYLSFVRNIPERNLDILRRKGLSLTILLIPELGFLLLFLPFAYFFPLAGLLLGMALFFVSLLLRMSKIKTYYKLVFAIFFGSILLTLGGYGWFLLLAFPISMILFLRNYYRNILTE